MKAKSTWRGTIAFGLASIPVGLYTAVRPHAVHLSSVHRGCGGRVRIRKICELHGAELSAAEIQRGADVGGTVIPLDDDTLSALPAADKRTMSVRGFTAAADVPLTAYGKPYHVAAEPAGKRAYALMRAAMAKSRTVAVVTVAFNGTEALAILRPDGDAITLHMIAWPDELVAAPDTPDAAAKVSPTELAAARTLIDSMALDLATVRDDYTDALSAVVSALPVPDVKAVADSGVPAPGGDLLATLQASVKATRKQPRKRMAK